MAVLFTDSVPYGDAGLAVKYDVLLGSPFIDIDPPVTPWGGRTIAMGANAEGLQKNLTPVPGDTTWNTGYQTLIIQCAYCWSSLSSDPVRVVSFLDGSSEQCSLWDNEGTFEFRRGGTVLGADATAHTVDTWYLLQIKAKIHSSTGTCLLKVTDRFVTSTRTAINLSGQNTQSTANAYSTGFALGSLVSDATGPLRFIHSVIVMDTSGSYCNDVLGPRMVDRIIPSADGYYHQSTPSTGSSRAALVKEIPPDTSDYNVAASGNIDTFVKAYSSNPSSALDAIVLQSYVGPGDGGGGQIEGYVRSNSTDGAGGDYRTGLNTEFIQSVIYLDPNTSAQFTGSGFTAAQIGYKRIA